jgi:leader peptidase (prepilin peptidase)/N-methyltransferase
VTGALDTAAFAAVACALGGLLVPALVARIPEPTDAEAADDAVDAVDAAGDAAAPTEPRPPKETYAAIAATPGLAARTAGASAVVGGLVGGSLGWVWPLLFLLPLVPVGVALAIVDWRTRLLPTRVIAPSYVVLVALVLVCAALTRDTDDLVRAGWGWLVAGGLFLALWLVHPRGLGYGDVRLSGVLGIALGYLGWGPLVVGVYAGFLLGGFGGGLLAVARVVERRAIPFGPFMLVGALVGVVAGPELWAHLVPGRR